VKRLLREKNFPWSTGLYRLVIDKNLVDLIFKSHTHMLEHMNSQKNARIESLMGSFLAKYYTSDFQRFNDVFNICAKLDQEFLISCIVKSLSQNGHVLEAEEFVRVNEIRMDAYLCRSFIDGHLFQNDIPKALQYLNLIAGFDFETGSKLSAPSFAVSASYLGNVYERVMLLLIDTVRLESVSARRLILGIVSRYLVLPINFTKSQILLGRIQKILLTHNQPAAILLTLHVPYNIRSKRLKSSILIFQKYWSETAERNGFLSFIKFKLSHSQNRFLDLCWICSEIVLDSIYKSSFPKIYREFSAIILLEIMRIQMGKIPLIGLNPAQQEILAILESCQPFFSFKPFPRYQVLYWKLTI
jgi:hypothetical protein